VKHQIVTAERKYFVCPSVKRSEVAAILDFLVGLLIQKPVYSYFFVFCFQLLETSSSSKYFLKNTRVNYRALKHFQCSIYIDQCDHFYYERNCTLCADRRQIKLQL